MFKVKILKVKMSATHNKQEIINKLVNETLYLKSVTDKSSECWSNFKVFLSNKFLKNLLQIEYIV